MMPQHVRYQSSPFRGDMASGRKVFARLFLMPVMVLALASCGEDSTDPDPCGDAELPLQGAAVGPVIVDVTLEVQPGGIVVLATATDPQGSANLLNVIQSIGVFPDRDCEGDPIVVQDDLAGSGVEESFGTAVDAVADVTLYGMIAGAATWPVTVDFEDLDGNRTTGQIRAAVQP